MASATLTAPRVAKNAFFLIVLSLFPSLSCKIDACGIELLLCRLPCRRPERPASQPVPRHEMLAVRRHRENHSLRMARGCCQLAVRRTSALLQSRPRRALSPPLFTSHESRIQDLEREARRDRAPVVRRRRRGQDPGASRRAHRRHAARQEQARVHAPRGHGRLRDRRQRGEDPRHRQEARREDLLPPLGLSREASASARCASSSSAGRRRCCARP